MWAASGGQVGVPGRLEATQLDGLERHGALTFGVDRTPARAAERCRVRGLDRPVSAPAKATDQIRGARPRTLAAAASRPGPRAGDEVEAEPGLEGDTVAHCGPSLKGEFARTVNLTDVHTGGCHPHRPQQAQAHILAACRPAWSSPVRGHRTGFRQRQRVPQPAVIGWAATRSVYFTRSRPYKNDQPPSSRRTTTSCASTASTTATTPRKNAAARRLWPLVNDRLNYLTPTKKPIGSAPTETDAAPACTTSPNATGSAPRRQGPLPGPAGRTDRLPRPAQPRRDRPQIADLQARLLVLAKDKTEQLYLASIPSALPDVRKASDQSLLTTPISRHSY